MRILICYTRFPWPTNKGDTLTVFRLLEYLSERHHVDFLTVDPSDSSFLSLLPKRIGKVWCVTGDLLSRALRLGRSILGDRSLQVDYFFSRSYATERQRLLAEGNYDVVYSHYIRSFGHCDFEGHGARKVIGLQLSHQGHFAKAASIERHPGRRWLYGVETKRLRRWESEIAGFNDLIHLISKRDLMRIQHHETWEDRVRFVPHGVDHLVFCPSVKSCVLGRVIFTGNLGFQANEDAVVWFAEEIWPRIVSLCEGVEWVVAGSRPSRVVRTVVADAQNARLITYPPNMAEVIQTGDVAVDPLRIGAGLQNKILESMACGVPVVATELANEGIGANDGEEIVLANDAEGFATGVIQLLENRKLRDEMAKASRVFIEKGWSWEYHFNQMEQYWQALVDGSGLRSYSNNENP